MEGAEDLLKIKDSIRNIRMKAKDGRLQPDYVKPILKDYINKIVDLIYLINDTPPKNSGLSYDFMNMLKACSGLELRHTGNQTADTVEFLLVSSCTVGGLMHFQVTIESLDLVTLVYESNTSEIPYLEHTEKLTSINATLERIKELIK